MRTRFSQRFISPYFAPFERRIYGLTGGRFQISSLLTPVLILHTIGAKSGQRRETPLVCWPRPDGSFLVAGSNWGKQQHPAWTANLLAHRDAAVVFRRRTIRVQAELLEGQAREAAWTVLESTFPGYREYERTSERRVRIFRLVPVAGADPR
jgi:deazaflavin-dependent oxidoreductase (nitroreductase family)